MSDVDFDKYFVIAADANPPTEPVPQTFHECHVTPIIDAKEYNDEIETALGLVGGGADVISNARHFIFIANWWLGLSGGTYIPYSRTPRSFGPEVEPGLFSPPYALDGPTGAKVLIDILTAKANVGVDVRVLGWVSFAVMDSGIAQGSGAGSIARVNAMTMESIKDLRAIPSIGNKAVLNVITHTAGSAHTKMLVIGTDTDAIGFTGGIDFESHRWARKDHSGKEVWHDVAAKVEGPAVQALYDFFKEMWHENLSRPARKFRFEGETMPSFLPKTPVIPARALPTAGRGDHRVQSLRTVPTFNYKWYNCLPENRKISFAPQGFFEFRAGMKKALSNAQTYIYIEDQSFWSKEIMEWINGNIETNPDLRVILMAAPGADPVDSPTDPVFVTNAINHGLLTNLEAHQIDQVRMFKRMGDPRPWSPTISAKAVVDEGPTSRVTLDRRARVDIDENNLVRERYLLRRGPHQFNVVGNPAIGKDEFIVVITQNPTGPARPAVGDILFVFERIFIHSKTVLVDDKWASIGSANMMRRSLYTELEHCISVLGESFVRDYRTKLWAHHFRHPTPLDFGDIEHSLHGWESDWGTSGAAPPRPSFIEPIPLPITPDRQLEGSAKEKYDKYQDVDARKDWGGLSP